MGMVYVGWQTCAWEELTDRFAVSSLSIFGLSCQCSPLKFECFCYFFLCPPRAAMEVMWDYLTDGATATLQRAFVEQEEPLCGRIHSFSTEGKVMAHQFVFDSVPTERLGEVEVQCCTGTFHTTRSLARSLHTLDPHPRSIRTPQAALFKELQEEVDRGVDMARMKVVIDRQARQVCKCPLGIEFQCFSTVDRISEIFFFAKRKLSST